jgi:serine/threonine protein kinase/tetratricopeptide (TPR) repeat protein
MVGELEVLKSTLQDQYAVEREMGRGGMAVVYLAQDLRHDRRVALKVLRRRAAAGVAAERFLREIAIAAKLTHPNILPVYDSGNAGGVLYYVMPYIEGGSLRNRLDTERRLTTEDALAITREVGDALSYAHRHGVVHRDIKPENILFESGHAILADFGVAVIAQAAEVRPLTDPGAAVGTPAYMSPEQATGDLVDPRTDVYALGCVLYEMLAGEPPFTGPNAMVVLARKSFGQLPSLRAVRSDVAVGLDRTIERALAVFPADRPGTAEEFIEALDPERLSAAEAPPLSIAVLPFTNMSADRDSDYLADGIAEEITNALAKIRSLKVVSRTSAFAFRDKKLGIGEIGRQLGVASVLEGSVRTVGDRLRVTAQLINVADGYHLWSERYDRDLEDIFMIEDEIAQSIVRALQLILSEDERRAIGRVPPANVRAYDYYLRGRQYFHQTRKKSLDFARQMFTRAIETDPEFALAHAGLADACSLLHMYYPSSEADLDQADAVSLRALELDPTLAEAHAARGFALSQMQRHEEAEQAFQTAIKLDGQQFEARYFYARALFEQGKFAEAARLFVDAFRVREDYQAAFFAAQSYAALRHEDDAAAAYRTALQAVERHLDLNPDDPRAATMRAVALCRVGNREAGLEWAERAVAIDRDDAGVRYNVACLYALEGETEKAIASLEDAVRNGFGRVEWFKRDPDLDSLRGDPRFEALLREKAQSAGRRDELSHP